LIVDDKKLTAAVVRSGERKSRIDLTGACFLAQAIWFSSARGNDQPPAELDESVGSLFVSSIAVSAIGAEELTIAVRRR